MKRYIQASESTYKNTVNVDVIYDLDAAMGVAASSIRPVRHEDGSEDPQALNDYDDFVTNVYGMMSWMFDIVEIEKSPKSSTSWYFWLYAKMKDGTLATKFIIRFRLSDHRYSDSHDEKAEKKFVDEKAQDYKKPADKIHQKWKLKGIIVNGDEFDSYWDAEEHIEDMLKDIYHRLTGKLFEDQ